MAFLAVNLGHLLGVRILLDVRVAIVALQAAVNAFAKHLAVNGNAVPVAVGHAGVAVACKTLRLRPEPCRAIKKSRNKHRCPNTQANYPLRLARSSG